MRRTQRRRRFVRRTIPWPLKRGLDMDMHTSAAGYSSSLAAADLQSVCRCGLHRSFLDIASRLVSSPRARGVVCGAKLQSSPLRESPRCAKCAGILMLERLGEASRCLDGRGWMGEVPKAAPWSGQLERVGRLGSPRNEIDASTQPSLNVTRTWVRTSRPGRVGTLQVQARKS